MRFFLCLASEITGTTRVSEEVVQGLFYQWIHWCRTENRSIVDNVAQFTGIDVHSDMAAVEDCFQINVFVYSIVVPDGLSLEDGDINEYLAERDIRLENHHTDQEDTSEPQVCAQLKVRSVKKYERNLFLNLNYNHFSRITDINQYTKFWQCSMCSRIVRRKDNYLVHLRKCAGGVRKENVGGGYGNKPSLFDKLAIEGVNVPDKFYPYRIVYDFECRFEKTPQDRPTTDGSIKYESKLVPVSVSITLNVPGYTEIRCFVDRDPTILIRHFYTYLCQISGEAGKRVAQSMKHVDELIAPHMVLADMVETQLQQQRATNGNAREIERVQDQLAEQKFWIDLNNEWKRWVEQIPVLGFNPGKFDLNLICHYLIPHLIERGVDVAPITRGSQYLSVGTQNLLFLDISNFLGPGTSYLKC